MRNITTHRRRAQRLIVAALTLAAAGCAVGQKPGQGRKLHLIEPTTGAGYWLYLPETYDADTVAGRHLPLVMTFHGMKPFDNAHSQICEWQQEADRYGYVVCAPELATPDISSPVPLRRVIRPLERDERRILAIMDELEHLCSVDPNHVLTTSWSYGGYIAHYMINQHPERFSCIAVKQSNFSEAILDPQQVLKYRDNKVGIFYTQNDFKICREESKAAARWYSRHGFDLTFAVFQDLGHERRPGIAASFFAHTCNATPKTPPTELARMQVLELPASETAAASATQVALASPVPGAGPDRRDVVAARSPVLFNQPGAVEPAGSRGRAQRQVSRRVVTSRPARHANRVRTKAITPSRIQTPRSAATRPPPSLARSNASNPFRVRLSSTIGISPLLVSFSVAPMPSAMRDGAFFLWTDNGEPISNGINGQKFLVDPGRHHLEVLVTTADGKEYRAIQTVTVLERINKSRTVR